MGVRKTIETAKTNLETGVVGRGTVWEENTGAAKEDYGTFFKPFLDAQNACGLEVEGKSRYDALVAYASCMKKKMG